MTDINWEATGVMVGAVLAAIGFHAWCMKLIIHEALSKNMVIILKEFATKEALDKHIEQGHP